MDIIAHRGAHNGRNVQENTLAAFQRAVDLGADGIELDVRLTKDGKLVVCHDCDIRYNSRNHRIAYYKLSALEVAGLVNDRFEPEDGATNPTLRVVLENYLAKLPINVEIKDNDCAQALADLVDTMKLDAELVKWNLVVSSFMLDELLRFKHLRPEVEVGYLLNAGEEPGLKLFNNLRNANFEAIHFHRSVRDTVIRQTKHWGFKTRAYTVNDVTQFAELAFLGADGVFTDKVPEMLVVRSRLNQTA